MRRAEALVPSLPGSSLTATRLWRQLLEHARTPLHRDAYALALSSAFTAVAGLLYWILAAHSYSAHAVGLNSALISAMMFLAGMASLNLPNILVRFLPESGERIRPRVIWSYAATAALAAGAAAVFIIGVGSWAPRLDFLRSDRGLQGWFVFSTIAWCIFVIQDSVLTALGRAVWVPVENAAFSFVKLGLLAVAAAVLPRYGIFVSWTIAMLVSVAGVNVLVFTRLMRRAAKAPGTPVDVRNRAFARYFAADYACSVAWLSTTNLMPVIVTAVAGATTNAYWALAYAVAGPLYLTSLSIGTSLMLHGTKDPAALPVLTRKAAVQGARVLIPAVALVVLLAPYLSSLFGAEYAAHGTTVLRLLALGVLPNFVVVLAVFVARVKRHLRRAVISLGAMAVIALGLATPLIHLMGVNGVGIGWIGAQAVVALGLVLTWRSSFGIAPPERPDARKARPSSQLEPRRVGSPTGSVLHPVLRSLFSALEQSGVRWVLLRAPSNLGAPTGDVDVLVPPADAVALREVAGVLGFVALPGWESGPDLILMRYDRATDCWLVLDVSTSISFRSPRSWRLPNAVELVLAGRQHSHGMALPSDADAFWLLLLHCLLDKRHVAPHYGARLRCLATRGLASPLGAILCSAAGPAFAPSQLVNAARSADEEALVEFGDRLAAALRRRRSAPERLRVLATAALRVARKPLLVRRRRGLSLALLGPNGVGKSTVATGLQRSLPFEVRTIHMGIWKIPVKPRTPLASVLEIATRPLRLWFRYLVAQYHQLRGRVVVFDRYIYEAHLPPQPPLLVMKRVYFQFLARALPRPRASVILDVPGDVAYRRKQENPPEELEDERRLYRKLTESLPGIDVVNADADASTVKAEITAIVWRELTLRWHGRGAEA